MCEDIDMQLQVLDDFGDQIVMQVVLGDLNQFDKALIMFFVK